MANELRHKDAVAGRITENEYEAIGQHIINNQAVGDIIYASAIAQLSRLGIGAANTVLHVAGGIPAWSATLAGLTLTAPVINGVITTTGLTLPAITLGGAVTINGQTLSGAVVTDSTLQTGGHLGVDTAANANYGIYYFEQITAPATTKYGVYSYIQLSETSAPNASEVAGLNARVAIRGTNTQNWTSSLAGVNSSIEILTGATGTVTSMYNFRGTSNIVAATLTNRYGLHISNATGGGTVTNQYGIYIADMTKGGTLDYGIYIAGADTAAIFIAGSDLTFGGSLDSALVADEVSLGGYEIGAGNRVLAISQETAVAADADETKFSNKVQVRINGATYFIMLTTT